MTSQNPILPAGQNGVDPALLGTWYGQLGDDGEPFYLHILSTSEDAQAATEGGERQPYGLTLILAFSQKESPSESGPGDQLDDGWGSAKAFAAETGGHSYLSIRFSYLTNSSADEMRDYHLYRYVVKNGKRLILQRLSSELLTKAMESGALKGDSEDDYITADSDTLAAFVAQQDPDALVGDEEEGVFKRVKP